MPKDKEFEDRVEVLALTVAEGRLDQWYRDLVGASATADESKIGAESEVTQSVMPSARRGFWFSRLLRDRR